jgi:hypothetical protein
MQINSNGDEILDQSYDTYSNDYSFRVMLDNMPTGTHFIMAVWDEASNNLSSSARNKLNALGGSSGNCNDAHGIGYRYGYIIAGIKGTVCWDHVVGSSSRTEDNFYFTVNAMRMMPVYMN